MLSSEMKGVLCSLVTAGLSDHEVRLEFPIKLGKTKFDTKRDRIYSKINNNIIVYRF